MLYIAKEITKTQPATMAFKERGIAFTQARISDVGCFGKARSVQLAHSGYKDNISAFLFATATKAKVICEGSVYTIPNDYVPSVPLPLPQTIFKPAKKFSEAQQKLMLEKLETQGIKKVDIGKGEPSYTITNPTFKTLTSVLPPLCLASTAFVDSHAQMEASVAAIRLYQCVDLFLATNTYYYKPSDFVGEQAKWKRGFHMSEARINTWFYREETDKTHYCHKSRKGDDGKEIRTEITDDEVKDLTPDRTGLVQLQDVVHVAKPSPLPSSTNFGPPSEVPFVGGLLFPYFQGLLVPDVAGLRALVSSLLLRNLGSSKTVPKEAYVEFRKVIGTFVNTPQGVLLTHVLKGMEIALDTQSVLYLLFDQATYMGFVILGTEFDIFMHGKWHAPLSAEALRAELQSLRTHEQSLADLAALLKTMKLTSGDSVLMEGTLTTCADIAEILPYLDLSHEEDEEDPAVEISRILSRISFKEKPLTFKPANIARSIEYLTGVAVFPREAYFHIPLKDWRGIDSQQYRIFAQYGPRSFSLRNAKGDEMLIRKELKEVDIFEVKDDKGTNLKYPKYIVGEKVLNACIADWEQLVEKRSMRMDFVERAAGSRNHVFGREIFKPIWEALKVGVESGAIGTKPDKKSEKKRVHDVAFGEGTFDESAFD